MTLEIDPFSFDRYMVNRLNEFFPSELTSSFWDWTDWLNPTFTMMSTTTPSTSAGAIEEGEGAGAGSARGGEVIPRGSRTGAGGRYGGGGALQRSRLQTMHPFRIDIKETNDKCVVDAELPGLNKENVKAHLDEHNLLTIEAELPTIDETTKSADEQYLLRERQHGRLMRSIRLPKYVNKDKVESSFNNGMLHLAFEKKAQERKQIPL
jgi:HSP20 family protein